jgi:hypothetical protein
MTSLLITVQMYKNLKKCKVKTSHRCAPSKALPSGAESTILFCYDSPEESAEEI